MKKNIGTADRIARVALGIGLLLSGLYFKSGFVILGGLLSLYEAVASWCVFYQLIGLNTCPLPNAQRQSSDVVTWYVQGLAILAGAVGLNLLAHFAGWVNWYSFIQQPRMITLDNAVFLFVVYPFVLGVAAQFMKKR